MGNKEKGANDEREFYGLFIDNCFRAVRVAGSGMMENTSCDLIAGKQGKKYCIECKASKNTSKYITKTQIEDFLVFSEVFGLEPVIAVRFNREGWFFLNPRQLKDSGKNWVVSLKMAKEKGKRFSQFFNN
ncbi:MAG: Holliday junction resolvase Hjc [Candidatus Pacearchaeota archaeon]|nr:Holliday junction resolvase Hjc [Candidatus Pacearchaeota archaeon]